MTEKIKVKVSSFTANILENDALRFGFTKNDKSNKNALLNKLIPTLVAVRKARRDEIENILKNEYNREDGENIYNAVNTVIDRVYFNGENLKELEEYVWIRPTKEALSTFNEIQTTETMLTAQEISVYIRGLLNEYARLPQYKREILTFDYELDIFSESCISHQIIHFTDKETRKKYRAFPFIYCYGYLYDQTNYCIIYDICDKQIKAIPLHRIQDIYRIKEKYKPDEGLTKKLEDYADNFDFEKIIDVEDEKNVF